MIWLHLFEFRVGLKQRSDGVNIAGGTGLSHVQKRL
jgi:hypothetical protein